MQLRLKTPLGEVTLTRDQLQAIEDLRLGLPAPSVTDRNGVLFVMVKPGVEYEVVLNMAAPSSMGCVRLQVAVCVCVMGVCRGVGGVQWWSHPRPTPARFWRLLPPLLALWWLSMCVYMIHSWCLCLVSCAPSGLSVSTEPRPCEPEPSLPPVPRRSRHSGHGRKRRHVL